MLGLAGQAIKIDTDTVIALTIGDDARGRVFSLLDVGINVALLCGIAVAGLLIGPGDLHRAGAGDGHAADVVGRFVRTIGAQAPHRAIPANGRPRIN